MSKKCGWVLDGLVIFGFLTLLLILFWPVVLGGKVLLPFDNLYAFPPWRAFADQLGIRVPHNPLLSDLILENYVWKRFIVQSLRAREIPLWNPYIFAGVPFLAAGQHSALYPLSILFYVLPIARAYGYFIVLQLFLAGCFAYAYTRVIRLGRQGAAVTGVTYMLSSLMIANVVHPMIMAAMSWLPLLLAMVELVVREEERELKELRGISLVPSGRQLLYLLGGSVVVGVQFLAGHIEISLYILLVTAFYSLWRLGGLWWQGRNRSAKLTTSLRQVARLSLWLGAMVALGGGLAGVQLIPLYELVRLSFRQGSVSYQQVIGWAYPLRQITTFLLPDFYGNPAHHRIFDVLTREWVAAPKGTTEWGIKNYVEGAAYVGLLPLLLAVLALWRRRHHHTLFFALLALLSLAFAFGTPLYALLYYTLPGFSQLHTPFRWVFPYTFSVAVLAGIGANLLARGTESLVIDHQAEKPKPAQSGLPLTSGHTDLEHHRWRAQGSVTTRHQGGLPPFGLSARRLIVGLGWSACALGLGVLLILGLSLLQPQPFLALAAQVLQWLPRAQEAFGDGRLFYAYQFRNLFFFGLFLAASGAVIGLSQSTKSHKLSRLSHVFVPFVIILDLFAFGYGFNPAVDPHLAEFTPPALEFLQQDGELYRLTSYGAAKTLWPNAGMCYDLADVRGYDSIIPKQYTDFVSLIEPQQGWLLYNRIGPLSRPESLDSPLLDLLNVKYVLTTQEIERPGYTLVYDEEIKIYRNDDYLPRAFVVPRAKVIGDREQFLAELQRFDPRQAVLLEEEPDMGAAMWDGSSTDLTFSHRASVITYTPNEVVIEVTTPRPGWLVLADSYFPGWRAYVRTGDGQEHETKIYKANYNFRAVPLPAGEHTVRFKYSPMSFKVGLYTSFLAAVVLFLGAAYWLWGRVYREAEGETVARVAKNTLIPIGTSLLNKVIDFAFAMLMLRILGPEGAGKYYFAIVVVGFYEIFTNFGLNLLLTREVAKDKSQANRYLSNTAILRLILWGVALPSLLIYLFARQVFSPLDRDTILAVALLTLALVPGNLSAALSSLFTAYERMEVPAAITTVTTLLKVSLGVLALLLGYGFVGLAVVSVVVNIVTAGIFLRLTTMTFFRPRLEFDPAFNRQMVDVAYPLMLNHLLQTLFFKVDVILLENLRGATVVGWYSTAYKWIDALLVIPAYFTMAIFPLMSRYAADARSRQDQAIADPAAAREGAPQARESLLRAYVMALRLLVMVALPIAMATAFIAEELIAILGGAEYLPHGAIALRIMIWFLPFSFANGVTQYVLIAINQQRWITVSFLIAAAFNVGANLLLIPPFGYPAAAAITIASELVLFVPFYRCVRQHLGSLPLASLFWRPTLAALGMGVVLWGLRGVNLPLALLVAGAVYLAGLVLLGAFTEEDRALLRRLLPSRRKKGLTLPV
ncbi:MAG: oligosaccharide flippase family protein [Anaerolineae bacterium]